MGNTLFYRNPPPPLEILENKGSFVPDKIGNTMYSKKWLYKTLMKMLEVVKEGSEGKAADATSKGSEQTTCDNETIIELDPKIEEDMCNLWDISANGEVACFLIVCNVAEIFLTVIDLTKSPRLLEIVVGILGNMSSFKPTSEYISKNKSLVHTICDLSGCSDSCSLVQLFRLLNCCISYEPCRQYWFDEFQENEGFMENLQTILKNNLCDDVLKALLEFLDRLLNDNSTYCSLWNQKPYVKAVLECGKQLLEYKDCEDLDSLFSVINTLCQSSAGLSVHAEHFEVLRPIFHAYFLEIGVGDEDNLPLVKRVTTISSAFAVYGNLLYNKSIVTEHVIFESAVFKAMLNLSKLVNVLLLNLKKSIENQKLSQKECEETVTAVTKTENKNGNTTSETDEEDFETWTTLLEAIIFAAKACSSYTVENSDLQILEEIKNIDIPQEAESSGT